MKALRENYLKSELALQKANTNPFHKLQPESLIKRKNSITS